MQGICVISTTDNNARITTFKNHWVSLGYIKLHAYLTSYLTKIAEMKKGVASTNLLRPEINGTPYWIRTNDHILRR